MLHSIIQVLLSGLAKVTKSRDSMLAFVLCSLVCATVVMFTSPAGAYTYTYSDAIFTGSFQVSGTGVDPIKGLVSTNSNPLINQSYPLARIGVAPSSTDPIKFNSYSFTGAGYTFSMASDPAPYYGSINVTVNHAGQIVDWTFTSHDLRQSRRLDNV